MRDCVIRRVNKGERQTDVPDVTETAREEEKVCDWEVERANG